MKKGLWWGCFAVVVLTGLLLVIFRGSVLPERFDGDAQSIVTATEMLREDPGAEHIDRYYTNSAKVFLALGVADKPMVVGIVGYLIVVGLVLFTVRGGKGGWAELSTIGVVLALSAVYLGTFSKDIFGVILVAGPLIIGQRKGWGIWAGAGGAVVFGLVFRPYYVVVALLALGYYLIWKLLRPRMWQWVVLLMMTVVAGVVGYFVVTGMDISAVREVNNLDREATSKVINIVEPGGIGAGIVNSLMVGGMMMVPVPLFLAGSMYHVLSGLLMMGLVIFVIGLVRDSNLRVRASAGLSILMALFVVQCLFEPDLGSVLRHWTMLGAVLIMAWYIMKEKYEQA